MATLQEILNPDVAPQFVADCQALIDGEVDYACTVRLKEGVTALAPLPKKALIRDLVTEIAPPDERLWPRS